MLAPSGLPYLSVSQVETAFGAEGCLFKWGQRYLAKNRPPPDGSAEVGSRVHGMNEIYMATGVEPLPQDRLTIFHKRKQTNITYAPGEIWASGKHLLPPRHLVRCEGKFRFTTSLHGEPVWWQGAKDLEWLSTDGLWHVGDLKTTVSWAYQKTADKLRTDWQANLYAYELMCRLDVKVVALDWFTFITDPDKPRECRPTSIVVLWPEVRAIVAGLEEKGRVLLSHYQNSTPFDTLPKNRGVPCTAFGGCPYRNTVACPEPTLDELFEGEQMSDVYADFMGSLDHRIPITPATPPPPVVMTPFTKPWAPGDPLNDTQRLLEQVGAPLSAIATAANVPPSPEVAATYTRPPVRPDVEAGFINPPEANGKRAPITPDELEAPVAASSVQTAPAPDNLDKLEREELKALGLRLGVWGEDCRWQAPRLRTELRAALKSNELQGIPAPPQTEPFVTKPADDGRELQQVSEATIRRIVRDELRALFTHV